MDPVWCTVNATILLFLVDKSVNIHDFSANYIRTTQIPEFFSHTIIISSRRRSIKTTKKILENYEYTGHSLDTITLRFSLLSCKILAAFIMPTYILVDTIKPAKVKCVYSKKKVPRYLPVHVH